MICTHHPIFFGW